MACKNANRMKNIEMAMETPENNNVEKVESNPIERLLFGVDSKIQANDMLQNNIEEFEWVVRNKIYPNFYGRYITGENCLTKDEIKFLHIKGCKIAPMYKTSSVKETEDQGKIVAKQIDIIAFELGIPEGTAIFLELDEKENVTSEFMLGFAKAMLTEGYIPAFKANTDAKYSFDREFSRGMQTDKDVFDKCLIWAVSPNLPEYERVTTTHLIHPDNWMPHAPSGIKRKDIAVWQYGKHCHPINDDAGKETTFSVDLVRNEQVIVEKMF